MKSKKTSKDREKFRLAQRIIISNYSEIDLKIIYEIGKLNEEIYSLEKEKLFKKFDVKK